MNEAPFTLSEVYHSWPNTGVVACNDVTINLIPGEIRALVGENGAGKTTLGHILAGVRRPDRGMLMVENTELKLADRKSGIIPDIALVRQRSIWPPSLKVWEAAVLGRERSLAGWRSTKWIEAFQNTAKNWNIDGLDPGLPVFSLDAATRQRMELISALMLKPRILILDEPSSAWEEGRSNEFFSLMTALKLANIAVLLITHRLADVFRIADTVTAMRHGSVTGNWKTHDISNDSLKTAIFGEILSNKTPKNRAQPNTSPKAMHSTHRGPTPGPLRLDKVSIKNPGKTGIIDIDFQVENGEILAIAGLRAEGLSTLEDVVSGNKRPSEGRVLIGDKLMNNGPTGMRRAGLSYVPSDKTGRGASMGSTLAENMLLLEAKRLSRRGWLNPSHVRKWAEKRGRHGQISGKPDQQLEQLSGGNIQKVILQRELAGSPKLLILADPSWGLDERSKRELHNKIRDARLQGTAILLLASDLDEALELSDRLGIMYAGRLSTIKPTNEWVRSEATGLISGAKA